MIHVDPFMEVSTEEDRSRVEGSNNQGCTKWSNIEEIMKTFESIEIANLRQSTGLRGTKLCGWHWPWWLDGFCFILCLC